MLLEHYRPKRGHESERWCMIWINFGNVKFFRSSSPVAAVVVVDVVISSRRFNINKFITYYYIIIKITIIWSCRCWLLAKYYMNLLRQRQQQQQQKRARSALLRSKLASPDGDHGLSILIFFYYVVRACARRYIRKRRRRRCFPLNTAFKKNICIFYAVRIIAAAAAKRKAQATSRSAPGPTKQS